MEKNAVDEIKSLSMDTRRHLQHMIRDGLQAVVSAIELGKMREATRGVMDLSDELRKMGL